MKFKINFEILAISILLILLLVFPLTYTNKSPYLLLENFKNKMKEGFNNKKFKSLLFKKTKFKPECCPNTYSNSMGCACMSNSQYKYLIERGGNNVPFSEY